MITAAARWLSLLSATPDAVRSWDYLQARRQHRRERRRHEALLLLTEYHGNQVRFQWQAAHYCPWHGFPPAGSYREAPYPGMVLRVLPCGCQRLPDELTRLLISH